MGKVILERYYGGVPTSYLDMHARVGETYTEAGARLKRQYLDEKKARGNDKQAQA